MKGGGLTGRRDEKEAQWVLTSVVIGERGSGGGSLCLAFQEFSWNVPNIELSNVHHATSWFMFGTA